MEKLVNLCLERGFKILRLGHSQGGRLEFLHIGMALKSQLASCKLLHLLIDSIPVTCKYSTHIYTRRSRSRNQDRFTGSLEFESSWPWKGLPTLTNLPSPHQTFVQLGLPPLIRLC